MTRVLYLPGSSAGPGGWKYMALRRENDFVVEEALLPFPDWRPRDVTEALRWAAEAITERVLGPAFDTAQAVARRFRPDVIVGSSLGGSLALAIDSPAARVLIAPAMQLRAVGVDVPNIFAHRRVPARTVILHAEEDGIVPYESSLRLLADAANRADPGEAATMAVVQEMLREAGYATRHGRLIRIGHDHRCNEPHPNDTWNRDPHPHHAMVQAVRILADIRD